MATYQDTLIDGYLLRLNVSQSSQNVSANTSVVSWSLQLIKGSGSGKYADGPHSWSVNIGGQVSSGSAGSYDFRGYSTLTLGSGTKTITHNADGTKAISNSASYNDNDTWGELGDGSCSGSLTLTTIPRATTATFTPTSVDAGVSITINTPRASSSFTHTLSYTIGTATGTIATGVATSTAWVPPLSLLSQIPNATSGLVTITTKTYSGATLIGTKTSTFTLKVPATVIPDFTGISNADANSAVATAVGAYVQNMSKLTLGIVGDVGAYGSTIVGYEISVAGQVINAKTGTTPAAITSSGTVVVTGKITDSRGRTVTKTINITVLTWAPPTITSQSMQRSNISGTPQEDGTTIRVNLNVAVSSLINSVQKNDLIIKVYTRLRGTTPWTLATTNNPAGITFNSYILVSSYPADDSFEVRVDVTDIFAITAVQNTIATAAVFMHWGGQGEGLGIGKFWELGAVDVLGQIYQNDGRAVTDTVSLAAALAPYGALVNAAGSTPGVIPAGTSAQRDTHWGAPSTAATRVALAAKGARWYNTDKGWTEQYFAQYSDAGSTPRFSSSNPGWKPVGRALVHPTTLVTTGGSATDRGDYIVVASGATNVTLQGVFTDDFEDYEVIIKATDNADNTAITLRTVIGSTVNTTAVAYGYNLLSSTQSDTVTGVYTADNFAIIGETSTLETTVQGYIFSPKNAAVRTQWRFESHNPSVGKQIQAAGHQGATEASDGIWFGLTTFGGARIQVFGIGR